MGKRRHLPLKIVMSCESIIYATEIESFLRLSFWLDVLFFLAYTSNVSICKFTFSDTRGGTAWTACGSQRKRSIEIINYFALIVMLFPTKIIFTHYVATGLPKHGFLVSHGDQFVRFRVKFPRYAISYIDVCFLSTQSLNEFQWYPFAPLPPPLPGSSSAWLVGSICICD